MACLKERKKRKNNHASSKKAAHINSRKGATWEEKPLHQMRRAVSEDQEGCEQTSQQTSHDKIEGEENARENVWSSYPFL